MHWLLIILLTGERIETDRATCLAAARAYAPAVVCVLERDA